MNDWNDWLDVPLPEKVSTKHKTKHKYGRMRFGMADGMNQVDLDFRCVHCNNPVSANSLLAGVQNRNHCPYCLYSRHLDLYSGGDRLSACKAPMKPVGLTLKKTHKKYGAAAQGELMIVHYCEECGRVSATRAAADDDPQTILATLEGYARLEGHLKRRIENSGILALDPGDAGLVRVQLFGRETYVN